MCSKLLSFCGTHSLADFLMLVHHYAFDIDLITLPDVMVLIYFEPILTKEWKSIMPAWKCFSGYQLWWCFNLWFISVLLSVCLICRNRAIVFISILWIIVTLARLSVSQSLSNLKLSGQELNQFDFRKGLQHESDSAWLGRKEHLWTCVMWTVICFHK